MVEIGGTVGDIENELFLESMRQMKEDVGRENIIYVHLTYVPIPHGVNEQKSKPTQQSVNLLKQRGIFPDIIIGRCSEFLTQKIKMKIANFCDVQPNAVITGLDVDDIYELPIIFEQEGLPEIIHKKLNIYSPPDLRKWKELIDKHQEPAAGTHRGHVREVHRTGGFLRQYRGIAQPLLWASGMQDQPRMGGNHRS